jgi:hypothetical protein
VLPTIRSANTTRTLASESPLDAGWVEGGCDCIWYRCGLLRVGTSVSRGRINHLYTGQRDRGRLLSKVQYPARPKSPPMALVFGTIDVAGTCLASW